MVSLDSLPHSLPKAGPLQAIATRGGIKSDLVTVGYISSSFSNASIIAVHPGQFNVARNTNGALIEVDGFGFGEDPTQVNVVMSAAMQIVGIHTCRDTRIVVDVDDTSGIPLGPFTASVSRQTPYGILMSKTVTVGRIVSALTTTPTVFSSDHQVSQGSTIMTISGEGFSATPDDVRVYVLLGTGSVPTVQVRNVSSVSVELLLPQHFSASSPGFLSAVVTVKGVRSASTDVALIGKPPSLVKKQQQLVESPVEGNRAVAIAGHNLFETGAICMWSSGVNTTVNASGDVSTVHCMTPQKRLDSATKRLTLSIYYPSSSILLKPDITISYFDTMLVSDSKTNSIIRFNAHTGKYWDVFVSSASGVVRPSGFAFGPDRNLYVGDVAMNRIVLFHGSTGTYLKKFADVVSPRGLVFHGEDLYVCSSYAGAVFRFNGVTGSPRGVLGQSHLLQHAWAIVFDAQTNHSLVASQRAHRIVQLDPPVAPSSVFVLSGSKVWSTMQTLHITGVEISKEHVYAVSPYAGNGFFQFNRTSGSFTKRIEDEFFVKQAYDIKLYHGSLYVCGVGGIRKYEERRILNELYHESTQHVSHSELRCAFLLINRGFT
jgi:hypothetical protein